MLKFIEIKTNKREELLDITSEVKKFISKNHVESGICCLFIFHTTAGITINENADPDVKKDILKSLNKIVPRENSYSHREGNAAAHVKSSLLGSSLTVFVDQGNLVLGTWQGIYLCEFDGPRTRKVFLKIIDHS